MTVDSSSSPVRALRGRLPAEVIARLLRAAADGDERAWDALVDEYDSLIWAVARAHRLHEADAADVAQVTWLRLLEHLTRIQDPGRLAAWLATTARRECLRVLRHGRRALPFGEAPDCVCTATPPGDALLEQERDEALREALTRLRPSDQALLRLLVADPRPAYEEIAAALDIPVGSIGPTRGRALERLRSELASSGALGLMAA